MMHWYDHGDGMSAWGWVAMSAGLLLLLGLLALGVLLLARSARPPSPPPAEPSPRSPEQILADRYARGEIDEEEYRSRLATLVGTRAGSR